MNNQQRWDDATRLIPQQNDVGGSHWHKTLFAGAYVKVNDTQNAKQWWECVLEREPSNKNAGRLAQFISDCGCPLNMLI